MKFIILLSLLLNSYVAQAVQKQPALNDIKNFRVHSTNFASSGLPSDEEIDLIAKENYRHVINLVPGDFSTNEFQATSLGMTYHQIEVDWENPKLSDFHRFAYYMTTFPDDEKAFVHCQLNYRASTFAYLYQVIVKEESQETAKARLLDVWNPSPAWLEYMNTVLEYYDELPNGSVNEK